MNVVPLDLGTWRELEAFRSGSSYGGDIERTMGGVVVRTPPTDFGRAWGQKAPFVESEHPRGVGGQFRTRYDHISETLRQGLNEPHPWDMSRAEFEKDRRTMWHGTIRGEMQDNTVGGTGIHVGTYEAARQALAAQSGWDLGPQETGKARYDSARAYLRKWAGQETANPDGSFSYMQHRIAGIGDSTETVKFDGDYIDQVSYKQERDFGHGRVPGWVQNAADRAGLGIKVNGKVVLEAPTYPQVHRGTGVLAGEGPDAQPDPKFKPVLVPLWIVGPMTNTPLDGDLRDDFWANGVMGSLLRRGKARRGMYYRNISEDEGSASAVVPSREHLATHEDFKQHKRQQGKSASFKEFVESEHPRGVAGKFRAKGPQAVYEAFGIPTTTRVFVAITNGFPIGVLTADEHTNTVELVYVNDDSRGAGIAHAMLQAARETTGLSLVHDTGERSPLGRAWAERQGLTPKLRPDELAQKLTDREATAMGARLMSAVWSADGFKPANEAARQAAAEKKSFVPVSVPETPFEEAQHPRGYHGRFVEKLKPEWRAAFKTTYDMIARGEFIGQKHNDDEPLQEVVDATERGHLPKVVSAEEFDRLAKDGATVQYHGTNRERYADDFLHGPFRVSLGTNGSGYYTATNAVAAAHYGQKYKEPGRLLRMMMKPDAKVVNWPEIAPEAQAAARQAHAGLSYSRLWPDNEADREKRVLSTLLADPGRYAALQGFDAIRIEGYAGSDFDHYIVLNREAVIVDGTMYNPSETRNDKLVPWQSQ